MGRATAAELSNASCGVSAESAIDRKIYSSFIARRSAKIM